MATKKTTSTKNAAKATSAKAKAPKAKKANPQKVEVAPAEAKAKANKHCEPKVAPEKKLSQFQAAIKVLSEAKEAMGCKQMVEAMAAKGYWTSPAGKTPEGTLYASILRDIRKGKDAPVREGRPRHIRPGHTEVTRIVRPRHLRGPTSGPRVTCAGYLHSSQYPTEQSPIHNEYGKDGEDGRL